VKTISALCATLLCCSCMSVSNVSLEQYLVHEKLALSTDNPPPGGSPLAVVAVHQTGFYLLGLIPISEISLADCVKGVAQQAEALRADGVANLRVTYTPPSLIPSDWSGAISMTGMAYRLPSNPAYPMRPPAPR